MKTKALEAIMRGIAPVIRSYVAAAQQELKTGQAVTQERLNAFDAVLASLALASMDATKEHASLRERVAVLETRPPLPGPPGEPGAPGKDGEPGKAGMTYQGVFVDGKTYELGDVVTWAGSMWHAQETTTTKPGEYAGAKAWTLCVKKGRDGKDVKS